MQLSENLDNESAKVPRRGPVPKFSHLEVMSLILTPENFYEFAMAHNIEEAFFRRAFFMRLSCCTT